MSKTTRIIECPNCNCYHRVDYRGSCEDDTERFSDYQDAANQLQKVVTDGVDRYFPRYIKSLNDLKCGDIGRVVSLTHVDGNSTDDYLGTLILMTDCDTWVILDGVSRGIVDSLDIWSEGRVEVMQRGDIMRA